MEKDMLCSWIKEIEYLKCSVQTKASHRFNAITQNTLWHFLIELEKIILKIYMEPLRET